MEVRPKKALGQHFLTDLDIAGRIVGALQGTDVLEVGPGTGVLTRILLERNATISAAPGSAAASTTGSTFASTTGSTFASTTGSGATAGSHSAATTAGSLKAIEIDKESAAYLRKNLPAITPGLIEGDFLRIRLDELFPGSFSIIGNFPYNISSQIFFKILDYKDSIPEVVCMIQREVAQRIAEKPGTKTYGILSVFLQAWYDIEYLFTVEPGSFNPPPKVRSAVIRLTRNSRTSLGCDEKLFRTIVKTAFGQRRKTLRNSLKPILAARTAPATEGSGGASPSQSISNDPVFDLRPEKLSVEDFISLTLMIQG